jgi:hypothetical protein
LNRIYLMQGDLDGACFLYSIANSVVALTSRKPTVNQWGKALQYIPFSHDFLSGKVGTKNYDDRSELYGFAVAQALSEYSPKNEYDVTTHPNMKSIEEVHKLISSNSVVILNISGEHWICVVDVDKQISTLLSVCSDLGDRVNSYEEVGCEFGRKYNRKYVIGNDSSIYQSSVIQIELRS